MYRDMIKVSKSIFRISYVWPSLCLAYDLGQLSGSVTAAIVNSMGFPGSEFNYRLENQLTFGIVLNIAVMRTYLKMRQSGLPMKAVRYEELVAKPLETCKCLMEFCGLPLELAEKAVRGLETDSQRNSPLAKAVIGNLPEPELTEESKKQLNRMLKKFDLPLIGEECILEGTLMINDRPN
jgi:hypothetical protein